MITIHKAGFSPLMKRKNERPGKGASKASRSDDASKMPSQWSRDPLCRAAMLEMPAQVMRELSAAAQVMMNLSAAARAATLAQPMALLGLIRWLRAHHDERTLPDAPAAQVARVVARWRRRFKVFRPDLLRVAAAEAGFTPEELVDHALATGVLASSPRT